MTLLTAQMHMGVNHLGHHLLTHLLRPLLVAAGTKEEPSRVINVSSDGHKFTMFSGCNEKITTMMILIKLYISGLDIDDEKFGLAR